MFTGESAILIVPLPWVSLSETMNRGLVSLSSQGVKKEEIKLILKAVKEQCQNIWKCESNRILPDVRSVIRKTGEHEKTFEVWSLKKKSPPSIFLHKENHSLKVDGDISAF